ncbi:MAG: cytidine deaminase [Clostridia bacterium]|nr:cytidine deaminase [Clostridia bacterium]
MMNQETINALVANALAAREKSYCPYSGFAVGAALLAADGTIYTGANIESASFTPTVCAERVAMFTAVHKGERNFTALAVVGGKSGAEVSAYCAPCGVCRQVLAEFCTPDFPVILFDGKTPKVIPLSTLLPASFGKADLT